MGLLHEDLIGSIFQDFYVLFRESSIASSDKIMVKGSVGVLWRADSDNREVQVFDGAGGDGCRNGILLPRMVRLTDQGSSPNETKTDNSKP